MSCNYHIFCPTLSNFKKLQTHWYPHQLARDTINPNVGSCHCIIVLLRYKCSVIIATLICVAGVHSNYPHREQSHQESCQHYHQHLSAMQRRSEKFHIAGLTLWNRGRVWQGFYLAPDCQVQTKEHSPRANECTNLQYRKKEVLHSNRELYFKNIPSGCISNEWRNRYGILCIYYIMGYWITGIFICNP